MLSVLDKILDHKRQVIANIADDYQLTKSTKDFKKALQSSEFSFIMECKKASPSRGLIRKDFDLGQILYLYNKHADAISVLTEERFFQGSFENLQKVSKASDKPILCKDFIFITKQVRQARYFGADAILLMMSVVTDDEYLKCSNEAKRLGMDVLTEVHDSIEVARALNLGAEIIGINNRNLKTLETDLSVTKNLSRLIPEDKIVITESGIKNHEDIMSLASHADGCLVGSSLMSQDNLNRAVEQLVYGDVKVCGITNQSDADYIDTMPSSSLGIIFAEKSKRRINSKVLCNKPLVGVFQNQSLDFVLDKYREFDLQAIQLHGDESQAYIDKLRERLPIECKLSKALHVANQIPDLEFNNIDEVLFDSQIGKQQGGTGVVFDWTVLQDLPKNNVTTLRIAGGIDFSNVQQLKKLGFSAIDLCSGSESEVGVKSVEKLEKLFLNTKIKARENYSRGIEC